MIASCWTFLLNRRSADSRFSPSSSCTKAKNFHLLTWGKVPLSYTRTPLESQLACRTGGNGVISKMGTFLFLKLMHSFEKQKRPHFSRLLAIKTGAGAADGCPGADGHGFDQGNGQGGRPEAQRDLALQASDLSVPLVVPMTIGARAAIR